MDVISITRVLHDAFSTFRVHFVALLASNFRILCSDRAGSMLHADKLVLDTCRSMLGIYLGQVCGYAYLCFALMSSFGG